MYSSQTVGQFFPAIIHNVGKKVSETYRRTTKLQNYEQLSQFSQ